MQVGRRSVGLVVREIFKSLFFYYVFIINAKKCLECCLNEAGRALSTYLGLAERHVGHTKRVRIMSSNETKRFCYIIMVNMTTSQINIFILSHC